MIRLRESILARAAWALLLWTAATANSSAQWVSKQISGRSYVSVDSFKSFYGFHEIKRAGNRITIFRKPSQPGKRDEIEVHLRVGQQECLMNNVKFVFTHKVEDADGRAWISHMDVVKLIDPVLRPAYIPNAGNFRTVIIDPGHGGKDAGATNSLGTEANYNLQVARQLRDMLVKKNYKVVMTRDSNRYLTLQERVDLANRVNDNAIFISIHFNSGGSAARGIETFTLSPVGVAHYGRGVNSSDFVARRGNTQDSANVALATAVHGMVLRKLGKNTFDRGIKRARFSVLTGVKHPAILFEGGFMSHSYEARLIHNEKYRTAIAEGIVLAIDRYRTALTNRAAAARKP